MWIKYLRGNTLKTYLQNWRSLWRNSISKCLGRGICIWRMDQWRGRLIKRKHQICICRANILRVSICRFLRSRTTGGTNWAIGLRLLLNLRRLRIFQISIRRILRMRIILKSCNLQFHLIGISLSLHLTIQMTLILH